MNTIKNIKLQSKKYIIISTPKTFLNHLKENKIPNQDMRGLVIEEVDYCLTFGYQNEIEALVNLYSNSQISKIMTCSNGTEEILKLKKTFMKSSLNIKMEENEDEEDEPSNVQKDFLENN